MPHVSDLRLTYLLVCLNANKSKSLQMNTTKGDNRMRLAAEDNFSCWDCSSDDGYLNLSLGRPSSLLEISQALSFSLHLQFNKSYSPLSVVLLDSHYKEVAYLWLISG